MNEAYKALGVSENVLAFSETILSDLKDRFAKADRKGKSQGNTNRR